MGKDDEIIFPEYFDKRYSRRTLSGEVPTHTILEQIRTERDIAPFFSPINIFEYENNTDESHTIDHFSLFKNQHIRFLQKSMKGVGSSYMGYDSSHPWIAYWTLHSLYLLKTPPNEEMKKQFLYKVEKCQNPQGGFGGGYMQDSHLASSYAAISSLSLIGTKEAYECVNRKKMYSWLLSLKQKDGSFCMHIGGEVDIRGAYCAFVIAKLCDILTDELIQGTDEWIKKCQTFEGGLSGIPGAEAHGGYTYCGLAALYLIRKAHILNLNSLLEWLIYRQMPFEGGFQGRCNKLVDACYSFWQGACFPLLHNLMSGSQGFDISELETKNNENNNNENSNIKKNQNYENNNNKEEKNHIKEWNFDYLKNQLFIKDGPFPFREHHLQEYILRCGQDSGGGLRDKPSKFPDLYHTCYALSGLSIAQNSFDGIRVLGEIESNLLEPTDPTFNSHPQQVKKMIQYFQK